MSKETMDECLRFLSYGEDLTLDVTGGAPEMNSNFIYFIQSARPLVKEIIVRSNLTVLFEPGKEDLPKFFKEQKVHLICSLPCYTKENVDKQRGSGVFEKSIKALKLLNDLGYSQELDLKLDLVYNPAGAFLPPSQKELEQGYKTMLKKDYGVTFNNLMTITNAPISRFKSSLKTKDEYNKYLGILEDSFNESVVGNIMCRTLLSVGWDGALYDCDFNQAKGMPITDEKGDKLNIEDITPDDLTGKDILFDDHCFSCTAGSGSSCQGALDSNPVEKTRDMVKDYYGKTLSGTKDLKTSACCDISSVPPYIRKISSVLEPEIVDKFYGCGSPIPLELEGKSILDLGCGTGRDSYILSHLVGKEGCVVGVDMTDEQLEVANKYVSIQTKKFGLSKPNIRFVKGYIEDLKTIDLKDDSFDVVVSNCVVNLSTQKDRILSEVFRVLKKGGEFFFSDVYSDRRLPDWTKEDPVLVGECLGGALYWKDFERLAKKAGFTDCRVFSKSNIDLPNDDIKEKIGFINFASITYRLFKIEGLEDACEDYGQVAVYKGGIDNSGHEFKLDDHHVFLKGKPLLVCGNSAMMLEKTRFSKYFDVTGSMKTHYGIFPGCGIKNLIDKGTESSGSGESSACVC
jgi:radical SAM/Cys-rich protein